MTGVHGSSFSVGPVQAHEEPEAGEVEQALGDVDLGLVEARAPASAGCAPRRVIVGSISRRTGVAPRWRRCRTVSIAASRSSASSSSTSTSASRVTRNTWWVTIVHAGEELVEVRGDHLLDRDEALAVGQLEEPRQERRHLHPREPAHAGHRDRARPRRGSATGSRCRGTGAPGRPTAASAPGRSARGTGGPRNALVVLVELVPVDDADPLPCRGRHAARSAKTRVGPRLQLVARGADRLELLARASSRRASTPPTPASTCSSSPETRIWKNSSRFCAEDREELHALEQRAGRRPRPARARARRTRATTARG